MKQVLFLCSANYCRSRFAEQLFNAMAAQAGLSWRARSRGLLVGKWGDPGPISSDALIALQERDVPVGEVHRNPRPLALRDLDRAEFIVAMNEAEHRPLLREQFPEWADCVEYWQVDSRDRTEPAEALQVAAECVRALVDRLAEAEAVGQYTGTVAAAV